MSIDQLTAEALALPPEDREALVQVLQDSLPVREEEDDLELDPKYLQELLRRVEELRSGKVVGRSWEEVLAEAERELGCD